MNLHWGRAQSYIILFLLYFLDRDLVLLFVLLKVEKYNTFFRHKEEWKANCSR